MSAAHTCDKYPRVSSFSFATALKERQTGVRLMSVPLYHRHHATTSAQILLTSPGHTFPPSPPVRSFAPIRFEKPKETRHGYPVLLTFSRVAHRIVSRTVFLGKGWLLDAVRITWREGERIWEQTRRRRIQALPTTAIWTQTLICLKKANSKIHRGV